MTTSAALGRPLWAAFSLCLVVLAAPAPAAVVYWSDAGTNDWNVGSNWLGGSVPTADVAGFRKPGTAYAHSPDVAKPLTVGGLQVDDGSAPLGISVSKTGVLTLGSVGINVKASTTTGTVTVGVPVTLGCTQSWINDNTRADAKLLVTGTTSLNGSTLNISGAGVTELFGSVNGGGSLAKTGGGDLNFTGSSGYTGATTISGGRLQLIDYLGSITASSGLTINSGSTLRIYNTGVKISGNRIGDTAPITLNGGTLSFENDASDFHFSETLGQVSIAAGSSIIYTGRAALERTSTLTISSLTRTVGATVGFSGTELGVDARNRVVMPVQPPGFLGGWATCGNDWAKCVLSQPGDVRSITRFGAADYTSHAEASWVDGDHVRLTGSLTTSGDRFIASLNLAQAAQTTLNLGGNKLTIRNPRPATGDGGILISGGFIAQVANGTLTSGNGANPAELIVTTNTDASTVTFTSDLAIADNLGSSVSLTKSGGSTLVIQGANTYSGITTIAAGILRAEDPAALGSTSGGTIVFGGTTLQLGSGNATVFDAEPLTLNGMGSGGIGALNQPAGSANNTWSGPITLAGDSRIGADGATSLTITGAVANGGNSLLVGGAGSTTIAGDIGGGGPLIKDGAGTATLSGSNGYTGGTTVQTGALIFAHAAALPAGTNVTVGSAGIVVFSSGFTGAISGGSNGTPWRAEAAPSPVPEPGTISLLAIATLCGLAAGSRRRRHLPSRAAG